MVPVPGLGSFQSFSSSSSASRFRIGLYASSNSQDTEMKDPAGKDKPPWKMLRGGEPSVSFSEADCTYFRSLRHYGRYVSGGDPYRHL